MDRDADDDVIVATQGDGVLAGVYENCFDLKPA
jgi:hypothetical protein